MIEYAIVGIKSRVITWIINTRLSYITSTSSKIMLTKCQSLTQILVCGFLTKAFAYLSLETKKEGDVNEENKNKQT